MILTSKAKNYWTNCSELALDLLYPRRCSLCDAFSAANPCIQCHGEMEPNEPAIVYLPDTDLEFVGSVYRYHGRPGQAARLLKYQRRTSLASFMAKRILEVAEAEGVSYDIATPVPIHWQRLAARGFNQAEWLASELPRRIKALARTRPTLPQAGLSTAERLKNLDGAFQVIADVSGKTVLLIDDVVTSGQTAKECAKVLRLAGAREVGILAFCGDR